MTQLEASAEARTLVLAQQAQEKARATAKLEAQQRAICLLEGKLARALAAQDEPSCFAHGACLIRDTPDRAPRAVDANAGLCSLGACPAGGCCNPLHML